METVSIKVKKPSIPVMRKLHKGQPATLTKGDDYEVVVSAEMAKKIKKAHDKGKGIRVKLEADAITEMEGKGAWSWLKKTTSKVGHAIGGATETVSKAVIGKSATKAIEKTGKIALGTAGKAAKAIGLATAKSLPQILKTGGAIVGGMAGTALAVETGQPELAPVGAYIGSQLGGQIGKDIGEEGKKIAVPVIRGKKKSTKKKDGLPDKIPTPKKPKLPEPKDPKKPAVPDAYLGRDTSGRLKTFSTLTGATADPVPIETQFQGTGKAKKPPKEKKPSKKGTQEMKDKMAKLRAMRKKKMSGEGIVAEGSGEGITMEMEGTGKAYTREEWTKKLCEGENSLLEQKKKKIDEREAKKAAKKAEAEAKKAATAKKSLNVRNPKKKAPEPEPEPEPEPPKKAPAKKVPAKEASAKYWIFKPAKTPYGKGSLPSYLSLIKAQPEDRKIAIQGLYKQTPKSTADDFTAKEFWEVFLDDTPKPATSQLLKIAKYLQREELGKIRYLPAPKKSAEPAVAQASPQIGRAHV